MTREQASRLLPFHPRSRGMHPFTLRFTDSEREQGFLRDYVEANLQYIRMAGFVATLLWVIFGLSDLLWTGSGTFWDKWLIRYGLVLPFQVAVLLAAFIPAWRRALLHLFALAVFMVGVGILLLNRFIPEDHWITPEVGFIVLVVASYTFFRFRFIHSLLLGVGVLLLVLLDLQLAGAPPKRMIYDLMLLLTVNTFGGFASYAMEYYSRRDYLHRQQREKRRKLELEAANLRTARELARSIAHEFNNPLTVIQSAYDLHVEPLLPKADQETRENLRRIPSTVARMNDLVNKLLNLTELKTREYLPGIRITDLHSSQDQKEETAASGDR